MPPISCFIAFALFVMFCSTGTNAPAKNTPEDSAIRLAVMAFRDAWNHHNMKEMGDVFTEDADLINVLGTRWHGRPDIVKALGVFHRVMFPREQIDLHDLTVRMIAPEVAVVIAIQTGSGEMTLPDGLGPRPVPMGSQLDTFVVVKRGGLWEVALGQNTLVDEGAQRFDPIKAGWNGDMPR